MGTATGETTSVGSQLPLPIEGLTGPSRPPPVSISRHLLSMRSGSDRSPHTPTLQAGPRDHCQEEPLVRLCPGKAERGPGGTGSAERAATGTEAGSEAGKGIAQDRPQAGAEGNKALLSVEWQRELHTRSALGTEDRLHVTDISMGALGKFSASEGPIGHSRAGLVRNGHGWC